jgi:hypothetical protein
VLDDVSRRLSESRPAMRPELRGKISRATGTAQQVLWRVTAKMCVDYVAAWQRDLERWGKLLANLPGRSSIEDALGTMGLH